MTGRGSHLPTPTCEYPLGHSSTQSASSSYPASAQVAQRWPPSPQRHFWQPPRQLQGLPLLGPVVEMPFLQVKGLRHSRPALPTPVGTVPSGQSTASTQRPDGSKYFAFVHFVHILLAFLPNLPFVNEQTEQSRDSGTAVTLQPHLRVGISKKNDPLQVSCSLQYCPLPSGSTAR